MSSIANNIASLVGLYDSLKQADPSLEIVSREDRQVAIKRVAKHLIFTKTAETQAGVKFKRVRITQTLRSNQDMEECKK